MTRSIVVLIAAGLTLALLAPTASAQRKRTRSLDAVVVKTNLIEGQTFAGIIRGGPLGSGAVVNTARPGPNGTFVSTGTVFCPGGTLKVRFSNTAVAQPDGSTKFDGGGTIVSGTAKFRGATGSFTFTGKGTPPGTITLDFSGSIRY